jgi:PGF-pre-PGF domain-containing protein/PGF-CTERM protein
VVVRLTDPPIGAQSKNLNQTEAMKVAAQSTQRPLEQFAANTPYVEIKDTFWITNAVLVSIETNHVPLERLGRIENVEQIHENFRVSVASTKTNSKRESPSTVRSTSTATNYTWGLQRIRTPETWQQFENRGDGVKIAVLDTGVDPDHPDITVANWLDTSYQPANSPKDYCESGHGTHVSGTVVGSNTSGKYIGVVPDAKLLHAAVLTRNCGGSFSQIVTGLQWAVNNNADIASLSLGASTNKNTLREAIHNARSAGTIPIVAVGNVENGNSLFPGNVYDSVSVGATNKNGGIADPSGGETIVTKNEWSDPPDYWPASYVVPDLSAPGSNVYSAKPGGTYDIKDGTSMATPHVSGAIALMLSNGDSNLTPTEAETILEQTAVDLGEDADRQGVGRIDVYNATMQHSRETLSPNITPDRVNVSVEQNLTVEANHPISTYYWTFPNGSTVTTTDATVRHAFANSGNQTVSLVLTDAQGKNISRSVMTKVVDEAAPVASITTNRSRIPLGGTVRFNASQTTDNGNISEYRWDFGDDTNTTTTTPVVNHTYTTAGNQTATLTAVDGANNTNTTMTNISVEASPTVTIQSIAGGVTHDGALYANDSSTLDITINATPNQTTQSTISSASVEVTSEATNYRLTPAVNKSGSNTWTATLNVSEIVDAGKYELTASATTELGTTNDSTAKHIKYDYTPPNLSAVITDVDADSDLANISIRSTESLVGDPSATVVEPGGATSPVSLTRAANSDRLWKGTLYMSTGGRYVLSAGGTDLAGNEGRDTTTVTLNKNVATTNQTTIVHSDASGLFIRLNTTSEVKDRTASLSETAISPESLNRNLSGVKFLEGELDSELDSNLRNATIGIPATSESLPTGIEVGDKSVSINYYNGSWQSQSTRVQTFDKRGPISGTYWTATVDSFSTYGVTINDTEPPQIIETTATPAEDDSAVTINTTYQDGLSSVNVSSVRLQINDTDVTTSQATSITSSSAIHEGYPAGDGTYDITLEIADTAGNEETYQRSVSANLSETTNGETQNEEKSSGNPSSGGGGGGSTGGSTTNRAGDDAPPTVQEVRSTLNLVQADADVSTDIADDNPDTPGLSVSPQGTQSVRNINFNNEELMGSVTVREYNNPPEQVATEVSASVGNDVSALRDSDINVVSVSDITVDTESDDTSATVRKTVSQDRVDTPEQLTVLKESYNFEAQTEQWEQLDTEVIETTNKKVVLEAKVDDFSLFAVAEVTNTTDSGTEGKGTENNSTDHNSTDDSSTDDGLPGFGAVTALLALIVTMFYARRRV